MNTYSSRLQSIAHKRATDRELDDITSYLKDNLGVGKEVFFNSINLHKALLKLLPYERESSDADLQDLLLSVGVTPVDPNETAFIIWESSSLIDKVKVGDLDKVWDDVWCPPADDALLIYLSRGSIVLVTDYDCVYYG